MDAAMSVLSLHHWDEGRERGVRELRRVELAAVSGDEMADPNQSLLAEIAKVLKEAGPRSLHVRQIAEQLAARNVLGGDISELERASAFTAELVARVVERPAPAAKNRQGTAAVPTEPAGWLVVAPAVGACHQACSSLSVTSRLQA